MGLFEGVRHKPTPISAEGSQNIIRVCFVSYILVYFMCCCACFYEAYLGFATSQHRP